MPKTGSYAKSLDRLMARPGDPAPIPLIDLFCGAGGLSLGFRSVGFRVVWANDTNGDAVNTFSRNIEVACNPTNIVEIMAEAPETIPKARVVVGGPPCQGFSKLNRERHPGDARRSLWLPFMKVVDKSEAEVFVMENVDALRQNDELSEILDFASKLGFQAVPVSLRATDFGVPQLRQRVLILGSRVGDPTAMKPAPTHFQPSKDQAPLLPWITLCEAIGDLPAPRVGSIDVDSQHPTDLHFIADYSEEWLSRFRAISPNGNWRELVSKRPDLAYKCWKKQIDSVTRGRSDVFGRLDWKKPSVTIRTEIRPEKGRYLHPVEDRPITLREAARIQSFPDGFKFLGTKTGVARLIGNAVPPLLAAAVARAVRGHLEQA